MFFIPSSESPNVANKRKHTQLELLATYLTSSFVFRYFFSASRVRKTISLVDIVLMEKLLLAVIGVSLVYRDEHLLIIHALNSYLIQLCVSC